MNKRFSPKRQLEDWWQRKKAWWATLTKEQKKILLIVYFFFGIGCFFMLFGAAVTAALSPLLKAPRDYSDPKMLKAALDLGFLADILSILGFSFMLGMLSWIQSNIHYSFYLEMRLTAIEKSLQLLIKLQKEIEEEAAEPTSNFIPEQAAALRGEEIQKDDTHSE